MTNGKAAAGGRQVMVIGAGIVGTCAALYLQREGFDVTLVDRGEPGEGASLGNAGSLGVASIPPTSMPGLLKRIPKMLRDPMTPLAIRWAYFPRVTPWLLRFLANGRRERVEKIADGRAALLGKLLEAYEPLLEAANAKDLIKREGKLHVYETPNGIEGSRYALDLRRRRGVRIQELTGDQAREIEPSLGPRVQCAVFFPDVRTVANPLRLTQTFARHLVASGGRLLRETVRGFELGPDGPRRVITDVGTHDVERIVIACGAWSVRLTEKLGTVLPLEAERGYHAMIREPGVALRTSITSNERYVVLTQMEHGLRVSGIAQFAGLDSAPDFRLLDRILLNAQAVVPGLSITADSRWAGPRPSMPDSMPVIGSSPRYPGKVFFAFGHDHIGLATGAITGRLISEIIAGKPTTIDVRPYRPDRFL